MISLSINGKTVSVEEGSTILEAAREAGVKIPTLCYNKELKPYGACRLCVVEITDGGPLGVKASCMMKASEGLVVRTDTDRATNARKAVLSMLAARFPDSEKIQELAKEWDAKPANLKPADSETCILCGMCVRACHEVSQRDAISFIGRGTHRKVTTPFGRVSSTCIGCGACAYLCPQGLIKIEEFE